MAVGRRRRQIDAVFVDASGWRRRFATFVGIGLGVALLASLGVIVLGLFGASPIPLPGFPNGGGAVAEQNGDGKGGGATPTATSKRPSIATASTTPTPAASGGGAGASTGPTATNPAGHVPGPPSDRGKPSKG